MLTIRKRPSSTPPGALTFEEVYQEYLPVVWHKARRLGVVDSALDDVCQDVFMAVYKRLPEFEGRSSLKTWVLGFVINVVYIHNRTLRRKSVAHRASGELIDPDTLEDHRSQAPDERVARTQAARIAHKVLSRLPEDKRAIYILFELEGMNAAEIATAAAPQYTPGKIHTRLRAARQQFSQAVERYRAKDLALTG
ncbi:MAG TPA: RNA polymerase sigma factor [Polyangiaceae bacterium]|nr:RNA polymerase sigma factor [Polyangiaceae bacterium]